MPARLSCELRTEHGRRLTTRCCWVSGLYEGALLFFAFNFLICGCEVLFALFFFSRSVVDRHSLCVWCLVAVFGVKPFVCGSKLIVVNKKLIAASVQYGWPLVGHGVWPWVCLFVVLSWIRAGPKWGGDSQGPCTSFPPGSTKMSRRMLRVDPN